MAELVPPPGFWQYMTDDLLNRWSSNGFEELSQNVRELLDPVDLEELGVIVYEIGMSFKDKRIDVEKAVSALNLILDSNVRDTKTLVIDAISMIEPPESVSLLLKHLPIDRSILLETADLSVLAASGLTTPMFEKRIRRLNTTLFYRQKRFNLLREESEGFSKLITEMYAFCLNKDGSSRLIHHTVDKIISIIGYFNLDPNRSLDVILDVFAECYTLCCKSFVDFLKASPWWPSRPCQPSSLADLDQGGSELGSQILGFKFISERKGIKTDSLCSITAVLIKEGFISLPSIYNYLGGDDEDIRKENGKWVKNMEEKAFMAKSNALAMAAPLSDDIGGSRTSSAKTKSDEQTSESTTSRTISEKIILFIELLDTGAFWPSIYYLARFPFLCGPFPEAADLIHRMMHLMIEPIYSKSFSLAESASSVGVRLIPSSAEGDTHLTNPKRLPSKRYISYLHREKSIGVAATPFYPNWAEGLPKVESTVDFLNICQSFLKYSGPRLHRDPSLLLKLIRIARSGLLNNDLKRENWISFLRTHILVVVPLLDPNPGVIEELSQLVLLLPSQLRYSLYGEWYSSILKSSPELKVATSKADKETKNVLKRLSKTNVREMMRQLAKISYSNPIPTFMGLISQVESYDNLGDLVVDAARYFTRLGWDALPLVILMQLTSGRGTMQLDGLHERKWLQSLSSFTAKLCSRYRSMDPSLLLQYIVRQLYNNDIDHIVLLQQMIIHMTGIIAFNNLTDNQIEGLAGGEELRLLTFQSLGDKRSDLAIPAKHFIKSLIDNGILMELFILLAQQKRTWMFSVGDNQAHTKILSSKYDDLSTIISQLIEVFNTMLTAQEFDKHILPIDVLCVDYDVEPSVAFALWESNLGKEIRELDEVSFPSRSSAKGATSVSSDSPAPLESTPEEIVMSDVLPSAPTELKESVAPQDSQVEKQANEVQIPVIGVHETDVWHPLLEKTISSIEEAISGCDWKYLRKELFVSFWQLSLYDIQIPLEKYQQEQSRLSDLARSLTKDPKKVTETQKAITELQAESKTQLIHYERTRRRLRKEIQHWFALPEGVQSSKIFRKNQNQHFIIHCILPRVLSSPMGALYCSRFFKLLHSLGTPHFSTLSFLGCIFADNHLYATLYSCTSAEAEDLARFLADLLRDLGRWHDTEETYMKEGLGYSKFKKPEDQEYLPGMMKNWATGKCTLDTLLTYSQLRRVLYKWHTILWNMTIDCLDNEEYMYRNNIIILLKNISKVFPKVQWHGKTLLAKLGTISKTETREDLKLASTTIIGLLKKQEPSWQSTVDFQGMPDRLEQTTIFTRFGPTFDINAPVAVSVQERSSATPSTKEGTPVDGKSAQIGTENPRDGESTTPKERSKVPENVPSGPKAMQTSRSSGRDDGTQGSTQPDSNKQEDNRGLAERLYSPTPRDEARKEQSSGSFPITDRRKRFDERDTRSIPRVEAAGSSSSREASEVPRHPRSPSSRSTGSDRPGRVYRTGEEGTRVREFRDHSSRGHSAGSSWDALAASNESPRPTAPAPQNFLAARLGPTASRQDDNGRLSGRSEGTAAGYTRDYASRSYSRDYSSRREGDKGYDREYVRNRGPREYRDDSHRKHERSSTTGSAGGEYTSDKRNGEHRDEKRRRMMQ